MVCLLNFDILCFYSQISPKSWVSVSIVLYLLAYFKGINTFSLRFCSFSFEIKRNSFTFFLFFTETNLKKQGMLPLTFENASDYDKISPSDRISLLGLNDITPGKVCVIQYSIYSTRDLSFLPQLLINYNNAITDPLAELM